MFLVERNPNITYELAGRIENEKLALSMDAYLMDIVIKYATTYGTYDPEDLLSSGLFVRLLIGDAKTRKLKEEAKGEIFGDSGIA